MPQTLIGVDIGTQGTRAALFTLAGRCLAQASCPSNLHQPKPGVVEENPEDQFAAVVRTIKRCLKVANARPERVAGVGIDGQMAGIIGVGRDGRHITPYDSWLDTRCTPYTLKMGRKAGEDVLEKTGCYPSINHGPKKLWWKHERPSVYRRIAAFVQPGAYAAMRLCGLSAAEAFIDVTYLHFSGFADNAAARWDEDLCQRFGLDPRKLPRIVRPETIVGELTAASARATGLLAGTPVVAGCGDTAASFLACGAARAGVSVDVAGTASVFASTTTEFRADQRHRMLGCGQSAVPGLWHPYAYINGGGMNLDWFRNEIANKGNRAKSSLVTLEQLNAMAAHLPESEELPLFVPHLGGRVCPSTPGLRGAWIGLDWSHSLAELYRAVLEGVALEYGVYKRVLLELYPKLRLSELRITGGGEKSAFWNALKADVLQTPVRRIARGEGAPMGAALVAGYGVGAFKSLSAAAKGWVHAGELVRPRKAVAKYYARRQQRYEALLNTLAL